MKEKKDIDAIFKESFKKIEATPSPRVWENIQSALKKEKKELRVIPLWIKIGGVAALIALMITVGNSIFNSSGSGALPEITDENTTRSPELPAETIPETKTRNMESQIASEDETLQPETKNGLAVPESNNSKIKELKTSNKSFNQPQTLSGVIATTKTQENASKSTDGLREDALELTISEKAIAENETTEKPINKKDPVLDVEDERLAKNQTHKANATENNAVKNAEEVAQETKEKKSIFEAIAENDDETVLKKKKSDKPEHRWNIAPNIAPVYYSSFGNGSSIDPTFADNPQKGDVNMSYGVQVSYALNNRLSVRTGVNSVDLSYSTSDIELGTGPVSAALRSVDYGGRETVVTVVDRGSFSAANPPGDFGQITPKSTQGDPRLIQNINYLEVPVELKYAILDNRLGVNLIGGLSTLFLGNNEISVKADNYSEVLGEANNLSEVSFSTNVGLGVDYKLSNKFTFTMEPMFKYQLNPYTDSSVSFKPYYLGVYSGLSFKF